MKDKLFAFKSLFIAYFFFTAPVCLLAGILAVLDISGIYFNENSVSGIKGLILSLILIPVVSIILAGTNWIALNLGQTIFNYLKSFAQKKK